MSAASKSLDTKHPAGINVPHDAPAEAYCAFYGDAFPDRSREVLCELMAAGVQIAPDDHNQLGRHLLSTKMFLQGTKALVSSARAVRFSCHLAVAQELDIIPKDGLVTIPMLLDWSKAINSKPYQAKHKEVNSKAKYAEKVKSRVIAGCDVPTQHRVEAFDMLEEVFTREKRRKTAQLLDKESTSSQSCEKLTDKYIAEKLSSFLKEWEPVASYSGPGEDEIERSCLEMYAEAHPAHVEADAAHNNAAKALTEFRALVCARHKHSYVQRRDVAAKLAQLGLREEACALQHEDKPFAWRLHTYLEGGNLIPASSAHVAGSSDGAQASGALGTLANGEPSTPVTDERAANTPYAPATTGMILSGTEPAANTRKRKRA